MENASEGAVNLSKTQEEFSTEPSTQPVASQNNSGTKSEDVPEGVKGWSCGAFFLNWIWAIGNQTWIGLLCFIPYIGIIFTIYLGFRGRELAWKNKKWDSVEEFNRIQRLWSVWGLGIMAVSFLLGFGLAFVAD